MERNGQVNGAPSAYTDDFYDAQMAGSRLSAEVIVPLVIDMVRPLSVVDVGCGVGPWLSVFKKHGVTDILGIDGDYVPRVRLQIPPECFLPHDLTVPVCLDRSFDLAVSVEVAEHLPDTCADTFVASLVRLAPIVLFSAAIPLQGGNGHINEQWPDYWATRFEEHGYVVADAVRRLVWQNGQVDWWYAQNVLIFARQHELHKYPELETAHERTNRSQLAIVHPDNYSVNPRRVTDFLGQAPLGDLLRAIPRTTRRALARRLRLLRARAGGSRGPAGS